MRTKAYVCFGLAMAIWGYSRLLIGPNFIASWVLGIILTVSALVLFFSDYITKKPSLKWLTRYVNFIDKLYPEYTVIGIGFLEAAIGLLIPGWIWIGTIFAVVAAVFLVSNKVVQVKNILDKILP